MIFHSPLRDRGAAPFPAKFIRVLPLCFPGKKRLQAENQQTVDVIEAGEGSRTPNLLITNQLLCH